MSVQQRASLRRLHWRHCAKITGYSGLPLMQLKMFKLTGSYLKLMNDPVLMWVLASLLTQRVSSCRCKVSRRDEPALVTWTLHYHLSLRHTTATAHAHTHTHTHTQLDHFPCMISFYWKLCCPFMCNVFKLMLINVETKIRCQILQIFADKIFLQLLNFL